MSQSVTLYWAGQVANASCEEHAEAGEASEMVVCMKGFRGSSIVAGVTCPLRGALTQLKICYFSVSPAVTEQLLAQGRCSSRTPLSSHPSSGLSGCYGDMVFHSCMQEGQIQLPAGSSLWC